MNANNTSRNSAGGPSTRSFGFLSNSGFSSGNGTAGSNYATNITLGSNYSPSASLASFVLPGSPVSSFAAEAQKSRGAMESGISALKSQSVDVPAQTGVQAAQVASGLISGGMAATGVGAPLALAMQASKMAGEAVQHGLNTSAQNAIGRDYISNQQRWSIGGAKAQETMYSLQQQRVASANTGAAIGSLFGPLGALAGWYIGKGDAFSSQAGYQVGSFSGTSLASDQNASRALNSDASTGQSNLSDTL